MEHKHERIMEGGLKERVTITRNETEIIVHFEDDHILNETVYAVFAGLDLAEKAYDELVAACPTIHDGQSKFDDILEHYGFE